MPSKQPFDHRRHLLNQDSSEASNNLNQHQAALSGEATHDDEALARILQEEILEEERRREHNGSGGGGGSGSGGGRIYNAPPSIPVYQAPAPSSRPPADTSNDMEMLMRLQREEMDALRNNTDVDDMELARRMQHEEALGQMQTDYQDQLTYARQIQERALGNNFRRSAGNPMPGAYATTDHPSSFPPTYDSQHGGSARTAIARAPPSSGHDSDLAMARRMQELESMGMGRMNSDRDLNSNNNAAAPQQQQQQPSLLAQQEEDDARLARMLSDSGQSLRNLNVSATPAPAAAAVARAVPPAARAAAVAIAVEDDDPPPPISQISFPQPSQEENSTPPPPPPQQGKRRSSKESRPSASAVAVDRVGGDDTFNPNTGQEVAAAAAATAATTIPAGSTKAPKKTLGSLFNRNLKAETRSTTPPRQKQRAQVPSPVPKKPTIPAPIPPRPPTARAGPLPYSSMGSSELNMPVADRAVQKKKMLAPLRKNPSICAACDKPATSFLVALDKKYHAECFKCSGCYQVIDSTGPFAYMTDEQRNKHPLHRKCYAELYGVKCAVCKKSIPAGPDGKVSFVKHPFFDKEQMCPHHAQNPGRRCTGCHRFEPEGEPFANLSDAGRCVCYSCCRSVVVDSADAQPLWDVVVDFFENTLHLPIWKDMRKVPILVVGYEALNDQMVATGATHGGSSQIMTRGLCLTEHQSGRQFKLASMKFNKNNFSFENCDIEDRGYTFVQVPDASKVNPDASVTAILCLSGLPKDLAASVLAHEATHAWIKLHPRYDISFPISPQVEEGCAQLVAMLFLNEGMGPASNNTYGDTGPSDAKLRQYFKFSIETDDHEIYGEGYRKAAAAYANIGIEALLSHVVLYKDFPKT